MATKNGELMIQAQKALSGKWALAVGAYLIFALIEGVGNFAILIIGGPLMVGAAIFTLNLARNQEADIPQLFDGFKQFGEAFVAYLLMIIKIFLWTLLFIVPGIIAAISYSQTFFILADNPGMKGTQALDLSRKMMDGHKGKYFCLGFMFIGWFILSILTLGIGFLWLIPYMQVTYAKFYDDLRTSRVSNV